MTAALDESIVLDAAVVPDEVAAWAAAASPWEGIATPVGELDPAALSPAGRVDLLVALERHRAWIDAQQQRLLAVMATAPGTGPAPELDRQWVREEVACALRISAPSAADRLHTATELVDRLPDTLTALHAGRLSLQHARTLVDAIVDLEDAAATKVEAAVLPRGMGQTPAQFTRSVRRAVLAADPRDAEQKHTDAVAQRRVVLTPQPDGMAELWALLPADQATALWTALNAAAGKTGPDDERTVDQRRADTLVSEDQTGTWRRLVTDPLGQLVDYRRSVYRPPVALADHVTARDAPADSLPAPAPPRALRSTTSGPGPTADPPTPTTSTASAPETTRANTRAAGRSSEDGTAAPSGPAPPDTSTENHPTNYPSTTPPKPTRTRIRRPSEPGPTNRSTKTRR